jgi:hypothetical protein
MNIENFEKWLHALRSGRYLQGMKYLWNNGSYCCLGVGCEVSGVDETPWRMNQLAPGWFIDWLGIPALDPEGEPIEDLLNFLGTFDIGIMDDRSITAASMNDSGKSFDTIADWLHVNRDNLVAFRP